MTLGEYLFAAGSISRQALVEGDSDPIAAAFVDVATAYTAHPDKASEAAQAAAAGTKLAAVAAVDGGPDDAQAIEAFETLATLIAANPWGKT